MRNSNNELFGHPKGLFVLFFTEMWERFSYYGMRAILVLYLVAKTTAAHNPGLGWTEQDALSLYGWYTMLVYVMGVPGGWISDRILGQKKAVLIGGLLLCIGHGILAVEALWAFYTGLIFIILGVGLLKPNISSMVGHLYEPGDVRRDKGFSIFYIGINLGSFIASLCVGLIGEKYGWHYGFGLAGIGMFLGQIVYVWGQKYLKGIGDLLKNSSDASTAKEFDQPLTKIEKDRIVVLILSFLIVIVFWGAYEQAGGLLNLYAKNKTDRMLGNFEVPASWFQALNPLFIIILGTGIGSYWVNRQLKGKASSSLFKMAIGTIIMGSGFLFMAAAAKQYIANPNGGSPLHLSSMHWLVWCYLLNTIGELCLSPVALSFTTKLAPAKYASLMMGLYFAMTGLGDKLAGMIGESASSWGDYKTFITIAIFSIVFSLLILLFIKKLNTLTHGAEEISVEPADIEKMATEIE